MTIHAHYRIKLYGVSVRKCSITTKLRRILTKYFVYIFSNATRLNENFFRKSDVSRNFDLLRSAGPLKECSTCKRFKERTVKVNQCAYRDFRIDPPSIPFKYIFIDHFGPYNVKLNGKKSKVWILCLTCLWSRAIHLKICLDLTTKEFLRAFQLHSYEYGIP